MYSNSPMLWKGSLTRPGGKTKPMHVPLVFDRSDMERPGLRSRCRHARTRRGKAIWTTKPAVAPSFHPSSFAKRYTLRKHRKIKVSAHHEPLQRQLQFERRAGHGLFRPFAMRPSPMLLARLERCSE